LGGHARANTSAPSTAPSVDLIEAPERAAALSAASTREQTTRSTSQGMTEESPTAAAAVPASAASWAPDAERELRKIPFFVRGKARRNTERYADLHSVPVITIETLYDAKAHFAR
jgi:light-independent protochlorophyllide reductase subunit B